MKQKNTITDNNTDMQIVTLEFYSRIDVLIQLDTQNNLILH